MTLDEWLTKHKIKKHKFADMLGISIVTLWNIRNGKVCNQSTADKILSVTGGQVEINIRGKNGTK